MNPEQIEEFGSAEALRAEVAQLRTRLANVKQAKGRLFARIIASAHLLDQPFTNSPELSPWELLKRDMRTLNAALRGGAEERSDDIKGSGSSDVGLTGKDSES